MEQEVMWIKGQPTLVGDPPPEFAEYCRAQAKYELSKVQSELIADKVITNRHLKDSMFNIDVDPSIIEGLMKDAARQVEVELALKYAEKYYPDFRLKIPKEDAAVDCETAADGTKYVVFYPKDGDKTICYQKFILKNEKRD